MIVQTSHRKRIAKSTTRSMPACVLAVAVGLMTATATLAPPVHADTIDDSFLAALNKAGVTYDDRAGIVAMGQSVCPMLVDPGKSMASIASSMGGNNGLSPDLAGFFTGIAISMYCPSMMSSLGNGVFLNWLQAPGLNR